MIYLLSFFIYFIFGSWGWRIFIIYGDGGGGWKGSLGYVLKFKLLSIIRVFYMLKLH